MCAHVQNFDVGGGSQAHPHGLPVYFGSSGERFCAGPLARGAGAVRARDGPLLLAAAHRGPAQLAAEHTKALAQSSKLPQQPGSKFTGLEHERGKEKRVC